MNQQKTEEAKEYIDTIWDIQNEFDLKVRTGDSRTIDALREQM